MSMRIGIIAEGHADVAIVKAVLKAVTGIDTTEMNAIRPNETTDETDNSQLAFSNWELVMRSCQDELLLDAFFNTLEEEALLVVHIDTAERGNKGYDVTEPQRTGHPDWQEYSQEVRRNVKAKLDGLLPEQHRGRVSYAIAIEETDAWLIPLYESPCRRDTATHVNPKEDLRTLIGAMKKKSKYIDTGRNNLNYHNLGKDLTKGLKAARNLNQSLHLFCIDVEEKMKELTSL
mgnify:FL=1